MQENKQIDIGGFTLYDSSAVEVGRTSEETENNITNALVQNIFEVFQMAVNTKKQEIAEL